MRLEHLIFLAKSDDRILADAAVYWLAKIAALSGVQQAIGNARNLRHLCDIVDAHDMCPAKNAGGYSRSGGP